MSLRADVVALVEAIAPVETALARLLRLAKGQPNRGAAAWAGDHAGAAIQEVSATVRGEVRDLVQAALEEGWRMDELAGELEDLGFDADRAATIAAQELRTARNAGRLDRWQAQDETDRARKVWIPSADPCLVCRHLAGQSQFLDEPFDSDLGPVDHPPAHINCLCTMRREAA